MYSLSLILIICSVCMPFSVFFLLQWLGCVFKHPVIVLFLFLFCYFYLSFLEIYFVYVPFYVYLLDTTWVCTFTFCHCVIVQLLMVVVIVIMIITHCWLMCPIFDMYTCYLCLFCSRIVVNIIEFYETFIQVRGLASYKTTLYPPFST